MTFKEARTKILDGFEAAGWTLSARTLKVPHATNPGGSIRIWFKPQAVHFTKVLFPARHEFKYARTLSYDLDIRKIDQAVFVARMVERYSLV
jgi:hypothetical protein